MNIDGVRDPYNTNGNQGLPMISVGPAASGNQSRTVNAGGQVDIASMRNSFIQ